MTSQPETIPAAERREPLWARVLLPCLTGFGFVAWALLLGGLVWLGVEVFTDSDRECWVEPLGAMRCSAPEGMLWPVAVMFLGPVVGVLSVIAKSVALRSLHRP